MRPIKYSVENYLKMDRDERDVFDVVQTNLLNELKEIEYEFDTIEILSIEGYRHLDDSYNDPYIGYELKVIMDGFEVLIGLNEDGRLESI